MSVTHLHADTYPYRPGTTIRAGKPCATGSGAPFMPTATSASRPSITTLVGAPIVMPSTDVISNWSDASLTPASRSRSASRAPSQRALLISGPPTGFDTQQSVIQRSISGRDSRSA